MPTIYGALRHLAEHYGISMAEAAALVKTPTHPAGLRDEFAKAAMPALIATPVSDWPEDVAAATDGSVSVAAYFLADKMLGARHA